MDYKKKYENALPYIKDLIEHNVISIENAEKYFPELIDSDEKIRKEIIDYIKIGTYKKDWIAWLEKQGEKPQGKTALEAAKEEKVDNANKVEPKFKGEDWITNGQLTCKVLSVTGKSYELHLYNDDYCHFETDVQSVDNDYHLWTIKDAKNGDVLTSIGFHSNCTFIFNGLDNWKFDEPNGDRAVATGYCCLFVSADKMELGMQGPDCIEVDTVKPATKIQRNLLFQKMKEAGWSWNPETKELSQSKVTKISDQDDIDALEQAMYALESFIVEDKPDKCFAGHHVPFIKAIEKLKSLKQRMQ